MSKTVLADMDEIIGWYKTEPWVFDSNVYRCYEACKRTIQELEHKGVAKWAEYKDYIKYITEKLGI